MTLLRSGLERLNAALRRVNLKMDTLTRERIERERLRRAEARGVFDRPPYPVPPGFAASAHQAILDELPKHRERFDTFRRAADNPVGFQFDNNFYRSPDAEVLYACVRWLRPGRFLEIGCGHSTRVVRQALIDGAIACRHVAIDPEPREEIAPLVDELIRQPVEDAGAADRVGALDAGDVLFIDTSHEARPANDVAYIYGCLIPLLRSGVVVHIHDIFTPYEYPRSLVATDAAAWGEQYTVQALLLDGHGWQVLWPGHHLQHTMPDFWRHFPHRTAGMAQSLWLRR